MTGLDAQVEPYPNGLIEGVWLPGSIAAQHGWLLFPGSGGPTCTGIDDHL